MKLDVNQIERSPKAADTAVRDGVLTRAQRDFTVLLTLKMTAKGKSLSPLSLNPCPLSISPAFLKLHENMCLELLLRFIFLPTPPPT